MKSREDTVILWSLMVLLLASIFVFSHILWLKTQAVGAPLMASEFPKNEPVLHKSKKASSQLLTSSQSLKAPRAEFSKMKVLPASRKGLSQIAKTSSVKTGRRSPAGRLQMRGCRLKKEPESRKNPRGPGSASGTTEGCA